MNVSIVMSNSSNLRPSSQIAESKDYQTIQETSNEEITYNCKHRYIHFILMYWRLINIDSR